MYIFSWNPNSQGAKALKDEMGIKRIKNEGSLFKGSPDKKVINWGSTQVPHEVLKCKILNHPSKVSITADKLKFFKHIYDPLDHDFIPDFTASYEEALAWVGAKYWVVARTILNGHSGAGIVLMNKDNPDAFVKAPLYVKYIPKNEEYRVHVIHGKVVDVQRKTLSKEKGEAGGDINWKIRNLDNGFIYQRANVNPGQAVHDAALKTVKLVGLDFGAVDIVVHKGTGQPYVLEVNSAPGLQGTSVSIYAQALKG